MINFTRAFESAWERMQVILFGPFDPLKWLTIGFSAFLAGLLSGGNGVNTSFNYRNNTYSGYSGNGGVSASKAAQAQFNLIHTQLNQFFSSTGFWVVVAVVVAFVVFFIALSLLFVWLGARGQFLLLDNIVRNRGAVSGPWQYYARPANSFFLFYLLLTVLFLVVTLPMVVGAIILCIPLFQQQRWPTGGETAIFVVLGLLYLALVIMGNIILFLYREFGPAIMFRQGLMARAAFFETFKVVGRYPGSVAVFILLRLALFIGMAIICIMLCCVTFCACFLSQWPYIGTLLLLPVLIFLRCFSLDCLAQFGAEYDVFTVDVPPLPVVGR